MTSEMDLIQHFGPRKVHLSLQNKNLFFHVNETKNRPESEMVSYANFLFSM